ncbi:ankyrin repeat domain-containing protein [bacterium]|jgi:ankyrin repeat protein|nr:ankyrin repeat domain-containing protein [bacterium]
MKYLKLFESIDDVWLNSAMNGNYVIIERLIKDDIKNITNKIGNTALMLAIWNSEHEDQDSDYDSDDLHYVDIIEFLLKNNVDINIQNKFGDTALLMSLERDMYNIAENLIIIGADVTVKNNEDISVFDYDLAPFWNDDEILDMILEKQPECINLLNNSDIKISEDIRNKYVHLFNMNDIGLY